MTAHRQFKVGLALGGGAARGLAHLGVLEVLEREGVPIDCMAGTSMGSLAGAMYAAQPRIEKIIKKTMQFYNSEEFNQSKIHNLMRGEEEEAGFFEAVGKRVRQGLVLGSQVTRLSYLEKEDLFDLLRPFVDDRDIRSLQIPLGIVVCDLRNGRELVLRKGPVIDAVAASSAVPGAFPPIRVNELECVDGGVVNMVPVSVARQMGADLVIAVNVTHAFMHPAELKRALLLFFLTQEITKQILIEKQLADADVVITPSVGQYHWADFRSADKVIAAGRQAAEDALPQIRLALSRAGKPRWRRLFSRSG